MKKVLSVILALCLLAAALPLSAAADDTRALAAPGLMFVPCHWEEQWPEGVDPEKDGAEPTIVMFVEWENWDPATQTEFDLGVDGYYYIFYGTSENDHGDPLSSLKWTQKSGEHDNDENDIVSIKPYDICDENPDGLIWILHGSSKGTATLRLISGTMKHEATGEPVTYTTTAKAVDPFITLSLVDHYDAEQIIDRRYWWFTDNSAAYLVSSSSDTYAFSDPEIYHEEEWGRGFDPREYFTITPVTNSDGNTVLKITVKDINRFKALQEEKRSQEPWWRADVNFGAKFKEGSGDPGGDWYEFSANYFTPGLHAFDEFDNVTPGENPENKHPHGYLGGAGPTYHFVYFDGTDGSLTVLKDRDWTPSVDSTNSTKLTITWMPTVSDRSRFLKSSWHLTTDPTLEAGFEAELTFTNKTDNTKAYTIPVTFDPPDFYWTTKADSVFPHDSLTQEDGTGSGPFFVYGAEESEKTFYLKASGEQTIGHIEAAINDNVDSTGWLDIQIAPDRKSAAFKILRSRDRYDWVKVTVYDTEYNPEDPDEGHDIFWPEFAAVHEHKWVNASNTSQHWKVCKGCGVEQENSRHNHDISGAGGACSICGYKAVNANVIDAGGVIGTKSGTAAGSVTVAGGLLGSQTSAVTINAGGNSVQYDSTALAAINAATSDAVTLVVEEQEPAAGDQKDRIEAAKATLAKQMEDVQHVSQSLVDQMQVMHVSLASTGGEIDDFNGGTATVTVPYTVFSDVPQEDIRVYRVETGGTLTQVPSTVNADNTVTWKTESHSYYMITPKVQADSETPRPVYSGGGGEETEQPARPFADVANPKAWYYNAVYYGYEKGYFAGVSATEFAPGSTMTRAMFATVLYNMADKPEVAATKSFSDVAVGKWYTNGILWGASQGVISGYPDGSFGTTDPVTREQMAVLLWNYAGKPAATADLSKFSDADKISTYAKTAINWAVSVGVISGRGNGILDPKGNATRAEVAQIVMNYDKQ